MMERRLGGKQALNAHSPGWTLTEVVRIMCPQPIEHQS